VQKGFRKSFVANFVASFVDFICLSSSLPMFYVFFLAAVLSALAVFAKVEALAEDGCG
jgi:hypothetical protein